VHQRKTVRQNCSERTAAEVDDRQRPVLDEQLDERRHRLDLPALALETLGRHARARRVYGRVELRPVQQRTVCASVGRVQRLARHDRLQRRVGGPRELRERALERLETGLVPTLRHGRSTRESQRRQERDGEEAVARERVALARAGGTVRRFPPICCRGLGKPTSRLDHASPTFACALESAAAEPEPPTPRAHA
jgi:hypothetical protein